MEVIIRAFDGVPVNLFCMSVVSSIRNIEEQGFRLQLVMGAVTPPTSMKLAHEKIMECYNNTTAGMSIMVNFIEMCEPINDMPNPDVCNRLDLYIEQVNKVCDSH